MAEIKTTKTGVNVHDFLAGIEPDRKRQDAYTLLNLMQRVTGWEPEMWGPTMIGFGDHHYRYKTGHNGDTFKVGFSPRKAALTLYIDGAVENDALLARLGKHKTSKVCLYVNKLADIDLAVLEELVVRSLDEQMHCENTH